LRRALLQRLPGYMVPGAIVEMESLPHSAHGKVDRQALPAPENLLPGRRERVKRPRDVAERNVARIFESVLGVSPVGRADDFFALGGTSLQAVEVLAAVEEVFDVALSPSTLVERPTVEALAALLAEQTLERGGGLVVTLREGGRGAPLFLIHSGQGDVLTYGLMVRRLKPRRVYGLQAPGLRGESWPLLSVEAMAERYLPEILALQPRGPYLLAGTCMGGMVAYELARRLAAAGRAVAFLGLIDSPTPPYSGRRAIWHEALLDPLRDALRLLRWSPVRLGARVPVRRLAAYRRFVAGMTGLANRRYRPGPFPGKVTLFLTTETAYPAGDRRERIGRFARETRIVRVAGQRSGLFLPPAVNELAAKLQACLDEADAAAPEADVDAPHAAA
jgi:acyl carrier protein